MKDERKFVSDWLGQIPNPTLQAKAIDILKTQKHVSNSLKYNLRDAIIVIRDACYGSFDFSFWRGVILQMENWQVDSIYNMEDRSLHQSNLGRLMAVTDYDLKRPTIELQVSIKTGSSNEHDRFNIVKRLVEHVDQVRLFFPRMTDEEFKEKITIKS